MSGWKVDGGWTPGAGVRGSGGGVGGGFAGAGHAGPVSQRECSLAKGIVVRAFIR